MANLAVWLLALAGPVVKRALIALGIGIATYAGYSALATQIKNAALSYWSSFTPTFIAIASIAGLGEGLGIVLSAFVAKAALMAASKYTKLL